MVKRAKRGRKSFASSLTSSVSFLSSKEEKKEEQSFCEKEAIEALLMLAMGFPADTKKKRKIEDTEWVDYAQDQSKKGRIEKETRVFNNKDGFMSDTPILPSSASGKFTCDICGKSFSCHRALGGHKSKCKINCSKGEEFALQDSMGSKKNQIDESSSSKRLHKCKICRKTFSTGQALGGHQKSHRIVQVEPRINWSSVSTPISKEEFIYPTNSATVVGEEAKDDLSKKKITLFDLNEDPVLEEEDELLELRLLSPTSILDF